MKKTLLSVMLATVVFPAVAQEYQAAPSMEPQNYQSAPTSPPQSYQAVPDVATDTTVNPAMASATSDPNMQAIPANAQYKVVQETTRVEKLSNEAQQQAEAAQRAYQSQDVMARMWNMSDDEIRQAKVKVEQKRSAINQDVSPNKCQHPREIVMNGSPRDAIPLLNLDTRNVTNMMFIDQAGSKWPIEFVYSNRSEVNAVWHKNNPESNIIFVNSLSDYSQGSFTVKLDEHSVPLVFSYASNQKNIDCVVNVRINKRSPLNAKESTPIATASDIGMSPMDASLNSVLYGMAPQGAIALKSSSPAVQAWLDDKDNLIVRTKYQIRSPMPKSRLGYSDGTWVFKLKPTSTYSSTIWYNDNGRTGFVNLTR